MTDDKTKRGMMAAHLGDEMSRKARQGWRHDWTANVARWAADVLSEEYQAEPAYRAGLACLGLTPEQIDAACAAIERGEWPADSLPGRLLKMLRDSTRYESEAAATARDWFDNGKAAGAIAALEMLGVKS